MSAILNRDEISIVDKLSELKSDIKYQQVTKWFTGDASETDFAMPRGWEPLLVFSTSGALLQPGSGNDYTVATAHDVSTITFTSAPSAANFCVVLVR